MVTFLLSLEEHLNATFLNRVDPVQYLYYMYYEEERGARDINILMKNLGLHDYADDESVFHKMFRNKFGWELRGAGDV